MATLAERVSDLAGAIRDKLNSMTPRLLPAGGGTNQVLAKTGTADYAVGWTAVSAAAGWTVVGKSADTSRTATTTLAADPDLKVSMAANTKYRIRGRIFFDTTATGDFKWRHAGPASPTVVRVQRNVIVPAATAFASIAVDVAYSGVDIPMAGTGANGGFVAFDAIIHNGAAAGDFSFLWAQNTSDVGQTIVRAGSYLEVMLA